MKKNEKNEKSSINLKNKITNMLELPKEIVLNLPLITIIGNEEINIENYKGVVEYTETKIRINTSTGILKIEGKKLLLKHITNENITITGIMAKMEYLL